MTPIVFQTGGGEGVSSICCTILRSLVSPPSPYVSPPLYCPAINGIMPMIFVKLTVLGCVSGWVLGQLLRPSDKILALQVSDEL
ncbi:hypothetical protein TIFTF001_045191 [Ficus carica]|uniref:Uncharacterized protein n=1 Tax=Ficus carica TaxID=3494 RepID=A0AA87Z029_FICCA|nr:hypothetical protein TIFTF001_045191 [Ficus carica]